MTLRALRLPRPLSREVADALRAFVREISVETAELLARVVVLEWQALASNAEILRDGLGHPSKQNHSLDEQSMVEAFGGSPLVEAFAALGTHARASPARVELTRDAHHLRLTLPRVPDEARSSSTSVTTHSSP